jgi:hypothetical protein
MFEIYARFDGDVDAFDRGGSEAENAEMPEGAWGQISAMLQSLAMVERGVTAPAFTAEVEASLAEHGVDSATRKEMLRIIRRSRRRRMPIRLGRVVREGRWRYAGFIDATVRIRESDTRFGSGDPEDPPEVRDDRAERCYYVDWHGGDGTDRSSLSGPFATIDEAAARAAQPSIGKLVWVS